MERLHKWDKDDTILTLYFVKYGVKGLPVKDEIELSEAVIGTTKSSLIMQGANVRYVLGYEDGVLDCFSEIQQKVVNEYEHFSQEELRGLCVNIITKRDTNHILENTRAKQKLLIQEKKRKEKEKKIKEDLDSIFRKMGKDPSKMKRVVEK